MKKSIKTIIFIIVSVILACYVFGFVMTFGHQREPQINMPPELGELEAQLHKETGSGISTFFKPITSAEIKNCQAKQKLYLFIANDSIKSSDFGIEGYLANVAQRANEILRNQECIDSLVIYLSVNDHGKEGVIEKRLSVPVLKNLRN